MGGGNRLAIQRSLACPTPLHPSPAGVRTPHFVERPTTGDTSRPDIHTGTELYACINASMYMCLLNNSVLEAIWKPRGAVWGPCGALWAPR